jgi:tetratricopeptide (TPR) repeat protein
VLGAACATPRAQDPVEVESRTALRIDAEVPPDLASAEERWRADPTDIDALVWYGRRTAYDGRHADAVALYEEGLRLHPGDAELLRHLGHRLLSLRRFDEAARVLEEAVRAIDGTPDELELDGLPNAYGVPRSTLHTNVWYHLGLAYHCLKDDRRAAEAQARCLALSPNDDMRVAAAYWRCLALVHLDRPEEARTLARHFAGRELDVMESEDYVRLLRLLAEADRQAVLRLEAAGDPVSAATLAYGVAMWHRLNGREIEARDLLVRLVGGAGSAAFGRIAAEVELGRM